MVAAGTLSRQWRLLQLLRGRRRLRFGLVLGAEGFDSEGASSSSWVRSPPSLSLSLPPSLTLAMWSPSSALARRSAATTTALLTTTRRAFGRSPVRPSFHFDTQALIERLEHQGLTREQATGLMGALAEVRPALSLRTRSSQQHPTRGRNGRHGSPRKPFLICFWPEQVIDESVTNMSAGMVPRSEQEKVCPTPSLSLSLSILSPLARSVPLRPRHVGFPQVTPVSPSSPLSRKPDGGDQRTWGRRVRGGWARDVGAQRVVGSGHARLGTSDVPAQTTP